MKRSISVESLCEDGASWSAQVLRQTGDPLSGPGAFILLFSLKTWAYHLHLFPVQVWGRGRLPEVVMIVWRGVQGGCGVFFQTYSKTR